VAVLVAGCLQEADRRQVARGQVMVRDGAHQRVEVADVVLVVGGVELRHAVDVALGVRADRGQRRRWQVVRVGRRGVVLERLVVRNVVVLVAVVGRARSDAAGAADGRADRVDGVAQALVAGRRGGELALELVGDERAGRLGAAGRGGEARGRRKAALELSAYPEVLRVTGC
jgi:hypothetical protein